MTYTQVFMRPRQQQKGVHDLFHSYQKERKKYQQQRVIPYILKELNQHQIGAVFKKCIYNWKR